MTPRLPIGQRRLAAEIMAIRRELSPAERKRLPPLRKIAAVFNAGTGVMYRSINYPYVRVHPKDRANYVPREKSPNNPENKP